MLGFESRKESGSGTTLGVLFPRLESTDSRALIGKTIVASLAWYFWPKMIDNESRITFSVFVDGEEIDIPDVRNTAPFSTFVKSYDQLNRKKTSKTIECQRPKQKLGRLSIATNPVMDRVHGLENVEVSGKLHHVAPVSYTHLTLPTIYSV